ncbi:chemotaxis protein CheW [Thiorhodococcus minor]|uniref:Chemotaxis protein CheW n=1 Tax=Thiorhodococcus minor TaxID=57489 RepID=A0A6M0K531_9GAMM|nr:chemotaxis protein CheW [Thiorhodococcus minor]NEV64878.1 chemotaxis protein CheW [Thiorhodococcus minor]
MKDLTTRLASGEPASGDDGASQYLTFRVADERYAIDILDVKEIIEVGRLTRVPMTPDHIRGVINLRGRVVAVVDLGARLGKGVSTLTKRSSIVLVEVASNEVEANGEQQLLGMLVDEVNEILEIAADHLQPAPDFGTEIRTDFIHAMGEVDEGFIILLDVNHVLSVDELARLGEMAAAATERPAEV